jgi:tRNA G10  N-methylase Trm11
MLVFNHPSRADKRLLPYLIPRPTVDQKKMTMILAFGDLSHLELCTVLDDELRNARKIYEDVTMIELKEKTTRYERLAGVHKIAIPLTTKFRSTLSATPELVEFLEGLDDRFNFSVSVYSPEGIGEEEYEQACSMILSAVRDAGFRKANLVRPKGGSEVYAKDILSRKILDFIIIKVNGHYWVGITTFVPDVAPFHARSNERPVVSSDISISSRLARILLNLSGFKKGDLILDPFCGSGTILSEAVLAGANCIGIDRNPGRIENTRRNLRWLSSTAGVPTDSYTLKVGDATRLETLMDGVQVDAVVTEPILLPEIDFAPHLEKARKMIRNAGRLYSEALYSMGAVVRRGGRVVIIAPSIRTYEGKDVSLALQDVEEAGLKPFQPHGQNFEYPVRISHENTKWIKRLVYVFERV